MKDKTSKEKKKMRAKASAKKTYATQTKKSMILGEMTQRRSPSGKIYFSGSLSEGGMPIFLFQGERPDQSGALVWELVYKG